MAKKPSGNNRRNQNSKVLRNQEAARKLTTALGYVLQMSARSFLHMMQGSPVDLVEAKTRMDAMLVNFGTYSGPARQELDAWLLMYAHYSEHCQT